MSFSIKKSHRYCNPYPTAPKEQDLQVDAEDLGISFTIQDLLDNNSNATQPPTQTVHNTGQAIRTVPTGQMDFY